MQLQVPWLVACVLLQVTIYDDMHMGDHVAIVGNLALSTSLDDAKVRETYLGAVAIVWAS